MYNDFAEVYDKLQDADYEAFCNYYEEIFKALAMIRYSFSDIPIISVFKIK